jgi:sulfatase maturation enzyme AslB (radical SAM superfamily)
MQYYSSPKNLSFEEIVQDFDRLMASVDHIFEIRLIGGEPFMNKEIYRVLEHIITTPNISRVVVYTNAMVPINAKYAALLRDKRIVFSITNYGQLANKTSEVISQIDDLGINYRQSPPVNWTDSGTILSKKISAASAQDLFEKCCGKNLLTLSDGKLYRCPFAANGERLGAFSSEDGSGVSLSARKFEIKKYVSDRQHIAACKYCKGRSFDSPEIIPAVQVKSPIDYVRS